MSWWLQGRYARKPEGATTLRQHVFQALKGIAKPVCSHCGLVLLNNPATRHAAKRGCWRYVDAPQ